MYMLLTCTLYYDARPGYLISSIRTVCKYHKCSFLTGLITSLTDLLQAYHQGWIGTSKTKSTGSPAPPRLLCSPNFSVSHWPKYFSVLIGSLFAGYESDQGILNKREGFFCLISRHCNYSLEEKGVRHVYRSSN